MTLVSETTAVPNAQTTLPSPQSDLNTSTTVNAASLRVTVIKKKSAWEVFRLGEAWQYRDLMVALAERDIKLRYRQTALGPAWVFIQPLFGAGITTILFGKLAGLSSGTVPYFLFAYVGMMGWNAFNLSVSKASGSLLGNSQLVSKVYFPRIILPFATLLTTLIDLGLSCIVLAIMLMILHIAPSWGILLTPVWLALLLLQGLSLGLLTGALMVRYRDIGQILGIVLNYGMWATPVGYSLVQAHEKFGNWDIVAALNPLSYLLEALRWSIFGSAHGSPFPSIIGLVYATLTTFALFFIGMIVFGQMERKFADVI